MSRAAENRNPQFEQFIEQAEQLNKAKNFEGALVAAKAAANLNPNDAEAWWHIGINQESLENHEAALKAYKKTVELAPHFSGGWSRYGVALVEAGEPLEAQDAFERALEEDDENLLALIYLSNVYEESGNEDGEFECLVKLEQKNLLDPDKWNRFCILHFKRRNFFDAINFYSKAAANSDDPAGLFNLGLVYNHPDVSQDANAIDAWRLTQKRFPSFDKAKDKIEGLLPRLLKLANDVRAGKLNLLEKEQWYVHYLNPFQLLNISKTQKFSEIDAKTVQRYKKALLHEIELESGKVSWLDNLQVDRSRAISLCEELNNEEYKLFHWTVYQDDLLLEFLSKGSIEHFLVHPEKSPLGTLDILDKDGGKFRKWASEPFSKQYNAVMTKTLEQEKIFNLESLLDGRLWVDVTYLDACYEGSRRVIHAMLEPLRKLAKDSENRKVTVDEIKKTLRHKSLLDALNFLPAHFEELQNEALSLVRSMAISANNDHGDLDLSKSILLIANDFKYKSANLNARLSDDKKKLNELDAEERQDEARWNFGEEPWHITKEGITKGKTHIPVEKVMAVRWGITVDNSNYSKSYDFLMAITGEGETLLSPKEIQFKWTATSADTIKKGEEFFSALVNASVSYVMPKLAERIKIKLKNNEPVMIGPCSLTSRGVSFKTTGWFGFSEKYHFVEWINLKTEMSNGELIVKDGIGGGKVQMPIKTTNNAMIMKFLAFELGR